jgi:ABC-type glycerol-3-phosphate transport system substrate-binding protein
MVDNGWTIPFIVRGQLLNLSDAMPSDHMDQVTSNYLDSMLATAQDADGNVFAQPLFADFPTMQYRKDWVMDAGYDPEGENWATEPMTWEKFSNVTKDVMESVDKDVDGYTFQAAAYEGLSCCDFNEFMSSWGGAYFGGFDNLFGPVGDRPITVDEQQVIDSIRMVRTFIHGSDDPESLSGYAGQIAPQAVVQYKEESSRGPFTNGNVVMHRNWPYSININGSEENFGEDLGVMPLPYAVEEGEYYENVGGSTSALGGWHLALNPNAADANMSAAAQVLTTLAKRQVQIEMFEIGGWIPPVPDRIATDATRQLDVIGRYVDTIAVAAEGAMPRPVTAVWPQQSSQISKEVNAAYRQQKSSEKAMSDLKASLEQIESSA